MQKLELTKKDAIHVATLKEFERIIDLYVMDPEYLNWEIFEQDTVLYPLTNQYGDINGMCKKRNLNVISSLTL